MKFKAQHMCLYWCYATVQVPVLQNFVAGVRLVPGIVCIEVEPGNEPKLGIVFQVNRTECYFRNALQGKKNEQKNKTKKKAFMVMYLRTFTLISPQQCNASWGGLQSVNST